MKNIFLISLILLCSTGCNNQKLTRLEIVSNYFNAFDSADYNEMKIFIGDSITITQGEYVMPYSRNSFHEYFKWDSIFKPSYKIIELKEKNNQIIASVASNSIRYEFLKNNPLTCGYKISFSSEKISKIEILECKNADWNIWQNERDSLVSWVNKNHPKLNGFIYDMTMEGALNYLKAIRLYENSPNNIKR